MNVVKPYTREDVLKFTRKRTNEQKIGELVDAVSGSWETDLKKSKSKFVLLGIPEDLGVRANYGRAGASTGFKPALESFLNQQHNDFLEAGSVFILGEIFVDDLMEAAADFDLKNKSSVTKLREMVAVLDERVSFVVKCIISLNKIPIIIGGGHNNSYGNIKGTSEALGRKINVVNCDPHLDFRPMEGRHSGNGFSYAYEDGFLNKYAVLAMHEQYNNLGALVKFREDPARLFYNTYESVFVKEELDFRSAIKQCIGFVGKEGCGVEIDLDAITNVPSSAKTSSGISALQARQFAHQCAANLNALYFHVAEGAPVLSHIKADNKTGKLISYLVTDFIKGFKK
jgi:formiminoglutamase